MTDIGSGHFRTLLNGRILGSVFALAALGCALPDGGNGGSTAATPDTQVAVGDDTPPVVVPEIPVSPDAVRITELDPVEGRTAGAELVTITGNNFSSTAKVFFGTVPAGEVNVLSAVVIQVRTPAHAAGPVSVTVRNPDGVDATLDLGFKFKDALAITSIEPAVGPRLGGTAVTVRGHGFTSATKVLIGGRLLVDQHVIDGQTLLGITPEGERAGGADILAFTDWTNTIAERAFRYTETPRIDRIEPVVGSTTEATLVTIAGNGLPKDALIQFGEVVATVVSSVPDGLVVRVPPAAPSSVDVSITTGDGETVAPGAFAFVEFGAPSLAIVSMWPHEGPESGGTSVSIGINGSENMPEVRFGTVPASVLSFDGLTLVVRTPVGSGVVDVTVDNGQIATLSGAFSYRHDATIDSVLPATGSSQGGELVEITGSGLPDNAEVFFGGLPAVVESASSSSIRVRTPVGSPGAVTVRIVSGSVVVVAPNAFTYSEPGGPKLYAIHPTRGAIAGGTLIRFYGSGFKPGAAVKFANKNLPDLQVVSASEIRARSIKADEQVKVDAKLEQDGQLLVLGDAYQYFDPGSPYGGSWGEPIHGTVNITVLDILSLEPVPGAFVMLWADPSTPYQGFADERGQIVFSGLDLEGSQMVTAAKQDYTAYSVVEYDAENVTVHLIPFYPSTPSPGGGGGDGPAPLIDATINGRVLGLGKYVVAPAKPCSFMAQKGLVGAGGTSACAPCELATDCAGTEGEYQCFDIAGEGKRCARSCLTSAECEEGYACGAGVNGSAACIPDPGKKAAYCQTTHHTPFSRPGDEGGPPYPHPDNIDDRAWTEADGTFWMKSRLGELSVICIGGVIRDELDPKGSFVPLAMGVARQITANSGQTIDNVEVPLNIPLRKDVLIRLDGAPLTFNDPIEGSSGPTESHLMVALDFAAEGYWTVRDEFRTSAADFMLDRQPENLSGKLDNVTYMFYADVMGSSLQFSGTHSTKVDVLDTDTLFNRIDGSWKAVSTGINKDIYGLWGTGDASLWAVGADGLIAHRKGGAWLSQFSPTPRSLRGVGGVGEDFAVAVGDRGTAIIFDGVKWSLEATGTEANLLATCSAGPFATWAVGEGVALRRTEIGWQPLAGTPTATLRGAYCPSATELWAVGDDGYLWQYDLFTGAWTAEPLTAGQGLALNAIAARSPADVWVVGSLGTVLHRTGPGAVEHLETPAKLSLNAVALGAEGHILAVGARGTRLSFDGLGFSLDTAERHAGDLRAVAYLADPNVGAIAAGTQAVTLGPMLTFPEIHDPGLPFFNTDPFGYHVEWYSAPGTLPTFNFIEMTVMGFPVWWTVIHAETQQVNFPNLLAIQGISPFPDVSALLTVTRILKPGTTVDNFDFWDTYDPGGWQSYSSGAVPISLQ